jgi:hypothetical protein
MDELIKQSKLKIKEIQDRFKADIITYLKSCDYNLISKKYQVVDLNNFDDLNKVYSGIGFYVILTSKNFTYNECQFIISDLKAIYRGHAYKVKDRIMSHLFSTNYKLKESKAKYKSNYTVCLKIEDGVNGIDIDTKPYSEHKWKLVVHKMRGSTELIRQQTEQAFDDIYKQPIKSREKKNSH